MREFVLSARPGGVKVVSEPAGAEIFVNETKRGVAPCTLGDLSPAVYTIRAVKAGYEPMEKTVEIVSGFQDEVRFSLVRSTGVLELTVRPAGVTVLVDGKLVGRTKSDGVSVTGTAPIVVREMAPGNHEVTVSHPRSRPESRTITVHVEKGKVCRPKAIDVWIANCEIRYKTGAVELGALYEENEKSILFGPEPGVKIAIDRGKLQYVRKLGSEDGE
ncbi:MAG: PEGA domain-containing protein [Lentisphaeria bacterium]|nr:MAG: PEGA domain-containing protein [Lentisphaeria bacterium]